MLIFDSHAHVFPRLSKASGYSSEEEHLAFCQRAMHEHLSQPPRRMRDNEILSVKRLWNPDDPSSSGRLDTGFRVGSHGRFEWEQDGEPCYIQYLPPYVSDMEFSADTLKAMMDYCGVSKAVLQCGGVYGRLNNFYQDLLKYRPEFRGVFFPLASVDPASDSPKQRDDLKRCIAEGHLSGFWIFPRDEYFGADYCGFWDYAASLKVPVFLAFFPDAKWIERVLAMESWREDYPGIDIVLPQAFPLRKDNGFVLDIPSRIERLLRREKTLVELIYPISQGNLEDFPFPKSVRAAETLYRSLGPSCLVWGSDIPMVERYCTYRQSLSYLTDHCPGIDREDLPAIFGGNLEEIFARKI